MSRPKPIRGNPSIITTTDWLHAHSPKSVSRTIDEKCLDWFIRHGQSYNNSGLIYPRDIFEERPILPKEEPELTLKNIDYEALTRAERFAQEAGEPGSLARVMFFTALSGKWLVHVPRNDIDEAWLALSASIENGELPYDAKVSTALESHLIQEKNIHVICVYTPNYLFREDVRTCRRLLEDKGLRNRLYYKPDIMTAKGFYRVTGSKINHRYYG